MCKEVLNLRSTQFNIGFHQRNKKHLKHTVVVEMQPQRHSRMLTHMRTSGSSFNIEPISVLKDVIKSYDPDVVLLDDFTNVPGVIEVITNDLKKTVLLDSNMNKEIVRFPAAV